MSEEKETKSELIAALCRARKNFKPIKKDTVNTYFGSKYATLEAYIDATAGPLADEGLWVVQSLETKVNEAGQRQVSVLTSIHHVSGEVLMCGTYPVIVNKVLNKKTGEFEEPNAQAYGSSLTYARRYGYAPALNLAAEDDDAEGAIDRTPEKIFDGPAEVAEEVEPCPLHGTKKGVIFSKFPSNRFYCNTCRKGFGGKVSEEPGAAETAEVFK